MRFSNQGIYTLITRGIWTTAVSTMITGFHDKGGSVYTETPLNVGKVTGTIFTVVTTLSGRALELHASVTMVNTRINVPAQ